MDKNHKYTKCKMFNTSLQTLQKNEALENFCPEYNFSFLFLKKPCVYDPMKVRLLHRNSRKFHYPWKNESGWLSLPKVCQPSFEKSQQPCGKMQLRKALHTWPERLYSVATGMSNAVWKFCPLFKLLVHNKRQSLKERCHRNVRWLEAKTKIKNSVRVRAPILAY